MEEPIIGDPLDIFEVDDPDVPETCALVVLTLLWLLCSEAVDEETMDSV